VNVQRDRVVGLSIALLLQAGFIAVLVQSLHVNVARKLVPREWILLLPKLPAPPPEKIVPHIKARPLEAPLPAVSIPRVEPAPQAVPLSGLGNALFGCAPQNFSNLSPEDQAKCRGFAMSPPNPDTVAALRSHVRDPEQRAAELAARRAPARVDCTHVETEIIDNIAQDHKLFVDPLCALKGIKRALGR